MAQPGPKTLRPLPPPPTVTREIALDDGSDARFRRFIHTLFLCLGEMADLRDLVGRTAGLTGTHFQMLYGIGQGEARTGRGFTIRELADHMRMAPPHMTVEVNKLAEQGLVDKRANPEDRRSVLVTLTAAGRTALDNVTPVLQRVNDTLTEGMSREAFLAGHAFLETFTDNAGRAVAMVQAELEAARRRAG